MRIDAASPSDILETAFVRRRPGSENNGKRQAFMLLLLLSVVMTGCTWIRGLMPGYRAAEERAARLQTLQVQVMQLADEYVSRVSDAIGTFQLTAESPEERLGAQNWKLQQATAVYTVASGSDALTNALDMVVLATLSRTVLEDKWVEELYGTRAQAVVDTYRSLEPKAWRLLDPVLTPVQIQQVHDLIAKWRSANPTVRSVSYIHFLEFAQAIDPDYAREVDEPGNLFALVGLDMFASLDPAVREIEQTRHLAERTIYYLQRAPNLMDMQVERLSYQLSVMPEARSLLEDTQRISLVGTAADRVSRELPDLVSREREALVEQLMSELERHKDTVSSAAEDVRATLQSGTETLNTLHAALESLDRIMARFPQPGPRAETSPPRKPFDVNDYTMLARELTTTIGQLDRTMQQIDKSTPALQALTGGTIAQLESTANRLLIKVGSLIVLTLLGILGIMIAYKNLSRRMSDA